MDILNIFNLTNNPGVVRRMLSSVLVKKKKKTDLE